MGIISWTTGVRQGTVAAQTKIDDRAGVAMKVRFNAAVIAAMNNSTAYDVVFFTGKLNVRFRITPDASGNFVIGTANDSNGLLSAPAVAESLLPAGDVVLYGHHVNGTGRYVGLFDPATGTTLAEVTNATAAVLPTTAGSGTMWLKSATQTWPAVSFDGLAIYSAPLSGANRYSAPQISDANILALFGFTEGTGTSAADAVSGGNAMALTSTGLSWSSGGEWPAPAPATQFHPHLYCN